MKQSFVQQKESLSRRANFLRIMSRTIAEGMKAGTFRSLYRGQGIEFSGVRDYIRGDDIRAIDWNVTARMGKPFVKLFDEEREICIFFVFDCSPSLFGGSLNRTKIDVAAESAALLTFAAEQNNCPVGCVFFDGAIKFSLSPKAGPERTMIVIKKLDEIVADESAATAGSILPDALNGALSLLRKRSLVFIISDFRVKGYEIPLARLAHKHDCVAIRITSATDKELPNIGTVPFVDSETKFNAVFPTNSPSFKKEWRQAEAARAAKWHEICSRRGVFPIEISTEQDPASVLVSFFERKRQVL